MKFRNCGSMSNNLATKKTETIEMAQKEEKKEEEEEEEEEEKERQWDKRNNCLTIYSMNGKATI